MFLELDTLGFSLLDVLHQSLFPHLKTFFHAEDQQSDFLELCHRSLGTRGIELAVDGCHGTPGTDVSVPHRHSHAWVVDRVRGGQIKVDLIAEMRSGVRTTAYEAMKKLLIHTRQLGPAKCSSCFSYLANWSPKLKKERKDDNGTCLRRMEGGENLPIDLGHAFNVLLLRSIQQ